MITLRHLTTNKKPKVALNAHTLNLARDFVLLRWKARAEEYGLIEPHDLSRSCKFSCLFVQDTFGGKIEANEEHCFNKINGIIVDLNEFSIDVLTMDEPYTHDPEFLAEPDFHHSLDSCMERVKGWVKDFHVIAVEKGYAITPEPPLKTRASSFTLKP
jgi:hypothetical protein